MTLSRTQFDRRMFLSSMAAGAALAMPISGRASQPSWPVARAGTPSEILAKDEAYWAEIATYYDRTAGIVNLEHGYWGRMAHPVQDAYIQSTRMVNSQNSFYARKQFDVDEKESIRRVADELGVHDDEIVLTRNATEAVHNLIRQYRGLKPGDTVLYADLDYPDFKTTMRWLQEARGVRLVELVVPPRASQEQLQELYLEAFDSNPDLRLMLVTHVSNQHGLVIPVQSIAKEAAKRGIDVICDSAQSWGLLDFHLPSLNVDWAAFNLHKWIGAPLGVGALYMRRGSLHKIAPYPGEVDPDNNKTSTRVHMGTHNFAAMLAIPEALDFHQAIGSARKEARLRYLRQLWTNEAESMPHIELLGGLDEASWTGMASFRMQGKATAADANELQQRLEQQFEIFTVVRDGLASGHCVRITPQVFTTPSEMVQLVEALKRLV